MQAPASLSGRMEQGRGLMDGDVVVGRFVVLALHFCVWEVEDEEVEREVEEEE